MPKPTKRDWNTNRDAQTQKPVTKPFRFMMLDPNEILERVGKEL